MTQDESLSFRVEILILFRSDRHGHQLTGEVYILGEMKKGCSRRCLRKYGALYKGTSGKYKL